jgi:hypothetical protein
MATAKIATTDSKESSGNKPNSLNPDVDICHNTQTETAAQLSV